MRDLRSRHCGTAGARSLASTRKRVPAPLGMPMGVRSSFRSRHNVSSGTFADSACYRSQADGRKLSPSTARVATRAISVTSPP